MIKNIEKLGTLFLNTISRIRLYGMDHPFTRKSAMEFVKLFEEIISDYKVFKFIISGDSIVFNDQVLPQDFISSYIFARKLTSCGIGFLEIKEGLSIDEFLNFCKEIAHYPKEKILTKSHISIGEVHFTKILFKENIEDLSIKEYKGDLEEEVKDEVKELELLHRHIKEHFEVKVKNFEYLALSFLKNFAKKSNILFNVANIKQHHKYTYLHSANVSNLVIGIGMALGLDKKDVFQFGLAALLHDLGKMFVPESILSKKSSLTEEEWEVVKRHPIEGSRLLLKQRNIPPIAVVVSFEHHIHFNGIGGYPKCNPPRKPCAVSQLVSIADCFDALFAIRSYHNRYDILSALEIVQDCSGSLYNPYLVDLFSKFINISIEEGIEDIKKII